MKFEICGKKFEIGTDHEIDTLVIVFDKGYADSVSISHLRGFWGYSPRGEIGPRPVGLYEIEAPRV